jgi:two-component system, NarL family, sensor histidine kinase DevS
VLLSAHDELALRVRDDGRGFSGTTRRSGLRNIAERAERHGGSCTVTSRPDEGTTVVWRVPLR